MKTFAQWTLTLVLPWGTLLHASEPPVYSIQEVATGTTAADASVAWAINSEGDVAGWFRHVYPATGGSALVSIDGTTELFFGPSGEGAWAFDINDAGTVVGIEFLGSTNRAFAILEGSPVDLGTLGGNFAEALGINAAGQIVGRSDTVGAPSVVRPFIYEDGIMTDLGGLRGMSSTGTAYDINSFGTAAGESDGKPVLFRNGEVVDLSGQITRLYGIPSDAATGVVLALNDSETGVGLILSNPYDYRYPTKGTGAIFQDGQIIPLTDNWISATARDINSRGDIVGEIPGSSYYGGISPYVLRDGVFYHLRELLEPGSTIIPVSAHAINDAGQIAGFSYAICERAVVMTPTGATRQNTVAAPSFSPVTGNYTTNSVKVTIDCATQGATIRWVYGSSPVTETSPLYTSPFVISGDHIISAKAFKPGKSPSPTGTIILNRVFAAAAKPIIKPPSGTYTGAVKATATCATKGVVLLYTLDGSEPTYRSPGVGKGVLIHESSTLKVAAFPRGATPLNQSATAIANYSIGASAKTAASPVITPGSGTYPRGTKIKIATNQKGAKILFSAQLGEETPSSPTEEYPKPIELYHTGTWTIRARTVATGFNASPVVTATFTVPQ